MPIPIFGYNETWEDCSKTTPDSAMRLPRREASDDRRARVARQGDPDRITGRWGGGCPGNKTMGHAELAALAGGPVGLMISGDAAGER
jgi:hypothetical protein